MEPELECRFLWLQSRACLQCYSASYSPWIAIRMKGNSIPNFFFPFYCSRLCSISKVLLKFLFYLVALISFSPERHTEGFLVTRFLYFLLGTDFSTIVSLSLLLLSMLASSAPMVVPNKCKRGPYLANIEHQSWLYVVLFLYRIQIFQ